MSFATTTTLNRRVEDFIDEGFLAGLIASAAPDAARIREIIAKSLELQPLSAEETAVLLAADAGEALEEIFDAARRLKRRVYGNRIVVFAPLYVGNECVNDCAYCAFKRSNKNVIRRTLDDDEIRRQVEAMVSRGHKRIILVFGEHPRYDADAIARCMETVYDTRVGHGEIRRVHVNAAPMDHQGYRKVSAAGLGVYQIFQETYHHATYARMHPRDTRKGDYLYRLDGVSRAIEAGCNDVGIGALFGLYDWRFEVLGLVRHGLHLQQRYGFGPHTISFPRLRPAAGVAMDSRYRLGDHDFKRLIAVLRLAAPYAGLICTAREAPHVRREVMSLGVSQIDAGSCIELGGYTEAGDTQVMEREQFELGDVRPLDEVLRELLSDGYIPSFCTSCYRIGRTGERFMEFAGAGRIRNFCTPNALTTLAEYLADYACEPTRALGEKRLHEELARMPETPRKADLVDRLRRIRESNERDLYF